MSVPISISRLHVLIQTNQAANGVISSFDALVDLLESIEQFTNRLGIYTQIPLTPTMVEVVVKIIAELISILAMVTKELKQRRSSKRVLALPSYLTQRDPVKFLKKHLGEKDVEAVLQRLDRLTQDEARSTAADTLRVVHSLAHNMSVVLEGKQMYSVCTPPFSQDIYLKMAKDQLTMSGNYLVCFLGNSEFPCLIELQKSYIKT